MNLERIGLAAENPRVPDLSCEDRQLGALRQQLCSHPRQSREALWCVRVSHQRDEDVERAREHFGIGKLSSAKAQDCCQRNESEKISELDMSVCFLRLVGSGWSLIVAAPAHDQRCSALQCKQAVSFKLEIVRKGSQQAIRKPN